MRTDHLPHTTHSITCHYEAEDGEHTIAVELYREFHGTARDWRITTDLSDVPDDERDSVEQQATDAAKKESHEREQEQRDRFRPHHV